MNLINTNSSQERVPQRMLALIDLLIDECRALQAVQVLRNSGLRNSLDGMDRFLSLLEATLGSGIDDAERVPQRMLALMDLFVGEGHALMAAHVLDGMEIHTVLMGIDKFRINLESSIEGRRQSPSDEPLIDGNDILSTVEDLDKFRVQLEAAIEERKQAKKRQAEMRFDPPEPPTTEPQSAQMAVPSMSDYKHCEMPALRPGQLDTATEVTVCDGCG